MKITYLLALTTGLFGGFGHCVGMCGPLVASYTLHSRDSAAGRSLTAHLVYNAGRMTTYAFVGSMLGLTGTFVNTAGRLAGIQNLVAIIAGLLMIAAGLRISGLIKGLNFLERHNGFVIRAVRMVLEGESVWRFYPLGLLLGLMPCGLSYSLFLAAAGSGGTIQGMLLLICFGLGTVPALTLFGSVMTYIGVEVRDVVYRTGGIAVTFMGTYFLVKGLSLYAEM